MYSSVTSAVTSIDNDREVPTSTTTYLHSKLYSESISTVIQTKSSDWSLSLGNSHKPESASTVSEESLHYLSTPVPSSSEYSILFTSEKEGHVSSYVPRVSYTSSIKVSISSTMSSENGMSATHIWHFNKYNSFKY